jgi:glycerol uptake facilitator-like aquaporin
MKNEKYWNGFIFGFFVGGTIGIIIYDLVIRGIL